MSLIASYCSCRATYARDESRRSDEEEKQKSEEQVEEIGGVVVRA
jgi:hypothetical protein